jgi:serine/threonine-protein kinase
MADPACSLVSWHWEFWSTLHVNRLTNYSRRGKISCVAKSEDLRQSEAQMVSEASKTPTQGSISNDDLLRWVQRERLATRDELARCEASWKTQSEAPNARSLLQILLAEQAITPNQARRVLQAAAAPHNQIPGYQLLERIGHGSMGVVYKARQLSMNRLVAIKVLAPRFAQNREFIDRFQREALLAAQLSNGNIVQAIDVGETNGIHYFIMEYVEGVTVQHELEQARRFDEAEALTIGMQVAQALEHAAKRGLVHRDIKPANILLGKDGVAKLADLGLARMTSDLQTIRNEAGRSVGTAYYISPEQIRGLEDVDVRSDIYSLGATLYHMTASRPPFPGPTIAEQLQSHLNDPLVEPHYVNQNLTKGFGELISYMMAKDRNLRYRWPADLVADMKSVMRRGGPFVARETIPRPIKG